MIDFQKVILALLLPLFILPSPAQQLGKKQLKFLQKHAHTIQIDSSSNLVTLRSLNDVLKNKRIVLLGEFTHGAKEINQVKNALIKHLHEELDYNVLLLESGVGEVMGMETDRQAHAPQELLSMGLFGPWRTEEYLDLMSYLKNNDSLQVGGFDVQRSGQAFAHYLEEVMALIEPDEVAIAEALEQDFGQFANSMRQNQLDSVMMSRKKTLDKNYLQFYQKITDHQKQLETQLSPLQVALTLKTIENRLSFLKYYFQFKKDNNYSKRWAARDSIMASNIIWFAEQVYPKEKIIISAHNFHIAKYNEKELVMGEILLEQYTNEMYSIGIFGGAGTLANNARKPEPLTPPTESNDIKRFVNASPAENTFINIPQNPKKGRLGYTRRLLSTIVLSTCMVVMPLSPRIVLTG